MGDRLVFLVDALDFEAFLMRLTTRRCSDADNHDNGNHNRRDLCQEQAVFDEEFAHTARPTLFFCSTCSAR